MIKIMRTKKFRALTLLLICLCAMLASPVFADALDGHKGSFGPKINGLQLGMTMTLQEMLDKSCEILPNSHLGMSIILDEISNGEGGYREVDYIVLDFTVSTVEGKQFKTWAINEGRSKKNKPESKLLIERYLRYKTLGELFDAIEKDNKFSGIIIFNNGDIFMRFQLSINPDKRLKSFSLPDYVFNAKQYPSIEDFAHVLSEKYDLSDWVKQSETIYSYFNEKENWRARIHGGELADFSSAATLHLISEPIPSKESKESKESTDAKDATKIINDLRSLKSAALLHYGDTLKWPPAGEAQASLDLYADRPTVTANPPRYKSIIISENVKDKSGVSRAYIGVELFPKTNGREGVKRELKKKAADKGLLEFDGVPKGREPKPYSNSDMVWMEMK